MFSSDDVPEIARLFEEADKEDGLNIEDFCIILEKIYGVVDNDELRTLHMQVDDKCDGTVDLDKLFAFVLNKKDNSELLQRRNDPFPNPFTVIPVNHRKRIVRLLFCPSEVDRLPGQDLDTTRPYQKGNFLSISTDGVLKIWSDTFEKSDSIYLIELEKKNPFEHIKKMHILDMVYISELQQLAVSTANSNVLFYQSAQQRTNSTDLLQSPGIRCSLKLNANATAMSFWAKNGKAVFSFMDDKGYLYAFVSHKIDEKTLFCNIIALKEFKKGYPAFSVSDLLQSTSMDYPSFKVPIFDEKCKEMKYFPSLDSFVICSNSSTTMVLVTLTSDATQVSKEVFGGKRKSEYFRCTDYSPKTQQLVTGGSDGVLRVWALHNTESCEQVVKGHEFPVDHIMYNWCNKTFVSISIDMNVRVWFEDTWVCRQSFRADGINIAPISSVCYNSYNNELLLANVNIAKCLGRGTDRFLEMLTSYHTPLCSALYHSDFKQVVSGCQDGVVTVWDVTTGNAVMEFEVTPEDHVGINAMSFDKPQRRLITVSNDGKVKLWNFNSGAELAVLPVTVHKKVTAIVCTKNRMFVSGHDSNRVFDLDMKKNHHRYLEHDYLKAVTSMELCHTQLLIASSNENVVIWCTETDKALIWLNANMSPQIKEITTTAPGHTERLRDTGGIKDTTPVDGIKTRVQRSPLMVCLRTREVEKDIATLLASAGGYIYAWSVAKNGGVLGKFQAVKKGAVVTTMSTDVDEQILMMGDSTGSLYLYDIHKYGLNTQLESEPPPLIGSWQAHLCGVVSIKWEPTCKNIVTAGLDCKVFLWTNTGHCKGLFGKDKWDLTQPNGNAYEGHDKRRSTQPEPPVPSRSPAHTKREVTGLSKEDMDTWLLPFLTTEELFDKCKDDMTTLGEFISEVDEILDIPLTTEDSISSTDTSPTPVTTLRRTDSKHSSDLKQDSPKTHPPRGNYVWVRQGGVLKLLPREEVKNLTHLPMKITPEMKRPDAPPRCTRLPPISDKVHLTDQTNFKPHSPPTPIIRRGTDLEQDSPKTKPPCLSHVWVRQGGVLKLLPREDIKHLTPIPPKMKTSDPPSRCTRLPPISDKVHLVKSREINFKPHPHPTTVIRSSTDLKQDSPKTPPPCANHVWFTRRDMLKLQPLEDVKHLTPIPHGAQRPDPPSACTRLPPISDKAHSHMKPILSHIQLKIEPKTISNRLS